MPLRFSLLLPLLFALLLPLPARADYALRDGDTVVFLGDSITAARTYGKIIENYTLLRFPQRKVRFHNAGHGGDTAAGGLARLERDVFAHGATVLLVAYGVNDIGWGTRADQEHKQQYLEAIRGIVEKCRERKVRVFICSAAITAADPSKSEHDFLQKMCDEGMALARSLGEQSIDVQRTMRGIQKRIWEANAHAKSDKDKTTLHAADGIHLNDLGQLAMAFAILKGLGAPAEVSAVTIDAQDGKLLKSSGCQVSDLKCAGSEVSFTRLDEGLPINFGLLGALQFRFIPIPDQLNRYMLTIRHLPEGKYEVHAGGRLLGSFTHRQLDAGLNISSVTPDPWQPGGPWDAEAMILKELTEARDKNGLAKLFTGEFLQANPNRQRLEQQMQQLNEQLVELQRTLVRPVPYHFVIRPAHGK